LLGKQNGSKKKEKKRPECLGIVDRLAKQEQWQKKRQCAVLEKGACKT